MIALITGGFDPIHKGHVELIKAATHIGPVVVGLNSDRWLQNKKGMHFMPFEERKAILDMMRGVIQVIAFDDSDGTAINAIQVTQALFSEPIVFCNGGDRTDQNIPEHDYCVQNNIEMRFGVGGGKANSSSWLLANWASSNQEQRQWGAFKTLYTNNDAVKVKELIVEPDKAISLQRHSARSEYWVVCSGTALVEKDGQQLTLTPGESVLIEESTWHRVRNVGHGLLKIVEVQHGHKCNEADIERRRSLY